MKKKTFIVALFLLFALVLNRELIAQSRNTVEWPDNEYTRQVPKPPFAIKSIGDMAVMGFIHINFVQGATLEAVEAYIESMKASGITVEVNTKTTMREKDGSLVTGITLEAKSAQGWGISIRYVGSNAFSMTIAKPK